MSGQSPVGTVGTDPRPAPLHLGSIFAAGFIALVVGIPAGAFLGTALPVPGVLVVGAIVFVVLETLFYVINRNGDIEFYRDHVEYDGDVLEYDDVSAAVRTDTLAHRLFGTADYELIAHGEENLSLFYVADPETAEKALNDRIPAPSDRLAHVNRRRQPSHLTNPGDFWHHWDEEEHPVPEEPVLEADELGDVLDVSVTGADLDELDDIDMGAAGGLGDIDAGDIGAAAGGEGGGGFDGGGGGE